MDIDLGQSIPNRTDNGVLGGIVDYNDFPGLENFIDLRVFLEVNDQVVDVGVLVGGNDIPFLTME